MNYTVEGIIDRAIQGDLREQSMDCIGGLLMTFGHYEHWWQVEPLLRRIIEERLPGRPCPVLEFARRER